jgi:UDP-N-acetylmuramate dehydrogenase
MSENNFQKNVVLAPYTNYKIGGPAEYFFEARSRDELINAFFQALKQGLKTTIIGGGCNVIVADQGIKGLVIINRSHEISFNEQIVKASSSYNWAELVRLTADRGLAGIEATIGIPGTVGGAVIGNAGCFGQEVKDTLVSVEVIENGKIKNYSNQEMEFAYRHSHLKTIDCLVISASFQLHLADKQAVDQKIKEVTQLRLANEDPLPSCGSTFKSIILTPEILAQADKIGLVLPEKIMQFGKLPAKLLIKEVGLVGKQIGQMKSSEINPNFIVNLGQGTADEFVQLVSLIKQQIRDKTGFQLEEEVRYLGF